MVERSRTVQVSATPGPGGGTALTITGTLDGSTYHEVRDSIIKAALEEPDAVIVDVSGLEVPSESAWKAITSAHWHVRRWPHVPILLVCDEPARRAAITRSGVTRHVRLHPDRTSAARCVSAPTWTRRRADVELDAGADCLRVMREVLARRLSEWGRPDMTLAASTVATVLVENVLEHTESRPTLIVETAGDFVAVAVSDENRIPPARREDPGTGAHTVSGLAIVTALSHAWGCTPTTTGKTVWALLAPENQF